MIVLPMAGESARFTRAGFDRPKYMLPLHGHSVFSHALGSFHRYFDNEAFLVICRDKPGLLGFIETECAGLGLASERVQIVSLTEATSGQAETVAEGLRRASVDPATALTVFNIDTFRPGFLHPTLFETEAVDGYLEVFEGDGDAWSFVRAADMHAPTGQVLEVAEKRRISPLCSDGLYHFRSAELFLSLYVEIEGRDPAQLDGGERYVAPLYDIAIQRGLDIRYTRVPAEQIRFCGTPEEYRALCSMPPFPPVSTGGEE